MLPSPMTCPPARRCFCRIAAAIIALAFLPALAAAQQSNVPARITQAIDSANLTVLKGNVHPFARPEFDRGPAPASLQLNRMLLVLQRGPGQEAALESLLDEQQDKSSPNYHQWLTPQQFGEQFGPADQDVQTIVAWLQTQGFQIERISNGRGTIEFSGSAGQVQNAFHTAIHSYQINGKSYWANASDPQIPAALAPVVAGIASLNSFRRKPMYRLAGIFSKSKQTGQMTRISAPVTGTPTAGVTPPNFTYTCGTNPNTGQPISCYGLGPYDFATIYNTLPLWNASPAIDGTSETIAIVARTNINLQDVSDFRALFGLPANPPNVILDGPDPGILPGDETESDLDVEWSGAVAKGATIDLVVSQSTETSDGVDLSALYIVDNDLAPVMSESYGECELGLGTAGNQFLNNLWQQAAAEGMTVFVSSGDDGSAGCDFFNGSTYPEPAQYGLEVNGIASTPYNVAVGGTDFNDVSNPTTYWNSTNTSGTQASAKGYIPEMTWNNTCTNGVLVQFGFSSNAETNCNNSQLINDGLLLTVGGGGGKSGCTTSDGSTPAACAGGYAKPSWQAGNGVPGDGKRDLPDVSLFASNGFFTGSFYMLCERDQISGQPCSTSAFLGVGGTSAAAPAFAGIMAMVDQTMASVDANPAWRQGNANYIFYKLAAKSGSTCTSAANPAGTCVFYDTPVGSTIAMPCLAGTTNCSPQSGHQYGVLPGYATTAGYDLATGLGSVNAANLVNGWSSVGNTPSTTTLTMSSVNITHGSPVPVSVTVTPNLPEPTGNVSLLAMEGTTPTSFGTLTLNTSGTASGTFTTLPGGTSYSVKAHYAGDATYAGSDSSPVTVTVNPEASKTSLGIITFDPTTGQITSTNATAFTYGSPYILRSDVTNSGGTLCWNATSKSLAYPCPTGSISLTDNGTALGSGTFALNSQGYTEYQAVQLTGGSHSLVANYAGDSSYTASSTTDPLTVTPAPTTTQFTFSPSSILIGTPTLVEASTQSASSGVAPTGTFTFYEGTAPVLSGAPGTSPTSGAQTGTATLFVAGSISVSAPSGPHTFTVQYNGDGNYASSTSSPVTIDVLYPTTMAGTATPNSILYGSGTTVTVTATLSTGAPAATAPKPTGAITLAGIANSTTTVTQDSSGNWVVQATGTITPQQTTEVVANYVADSNYEGASTIIWVNVVVPDFTVSTNSAALAVTAGQTGTATITVTPSTNYTSTVALTCGVPASFGGSTCSISPASVTLSNGAAATATLSIATMAPSSGLSAMELPLRMRGRRPAFPYPAGCWSLAALLLSASLMMLLLPGRRRVFHVSLGLAAAGLLSFAIGCGGSNSGGGGGGGTPGNPIPTTTTISTAATKVAANVGTTFTATVSPASATGDVFFSSTCQGGTAASLTNGTAQAMINSLPGTCRISAAYEGDGDHQISQSGTLNIAFTGATSVGVNGQTGPDAHGITVNVTLQ